MARPKSTSYSDKDRERIIEHVLAEVSGGRAVSRILAEDDGMPAASQFWKWHFESTELQEKVARARENGVEAIMDETLSIADHTAQDTVRDAEGNERPNTEWISRSRLRVDARHKYAQMIAPRKYGAKIDVTSGGEKIEADDVTRATRLAAIFAEIEKRNAAD